MPCDFFSNAIFFHQKSLQKTNQWESGGGEKGVNRKFKTTLEFMINDG